MSTLTWNIEHTDTFGGEANYCWVNRHTIELPETYNRAWIVRKVKEQVGWTGTRCTVEDLGSYLQIKPAGMCQVVFATVAD